MKRLHVRVSHKWQYIQWRCNYVRLKVSSGWCQCIQQHHATASSSDGDRQWIHSVNPLVSSIGAKDNFSYDNFAVKLSNIQYKSVKSDHNFKNWSKIKIQDDNAYVNKNKNTITRSRKFGGKVTLPLYYIRQWMYRIWYNHRVTAHQVFVAQRIHTDCRGIYEIAIIYHETTYHNAKPL